MTSDGIITGVFGPVIQAKAFHEVKMFEVSFIGKARLLGEVIRIKEDMIDVQVYENTEGLRTGEPIELTGNLLSLELGPGLLGNVFDGIGRPLNKISENGIFIPRGLHCDTLPRTKKWQFTPFLKTGDPVTAGDAIGEVLEGTYLKHQVLVPPYHKDSTIEHIVTMGNYSLEDTVCVLSNGTEISLSHEWEVRKPRPYRKRLPFTFPLLTGQRILDTMFPVALGGSAVLPGGFGTGKTITQQSLAKWCNADIIIYIGCGERGNEMTEVLEEFPEIQDPENNAPLMERMVLIANTSNMPVAAREASIYLGMTIGEYYRDMGFDVAMMADSTSRWAEALREIAGRLEEMPGEEGYPAYLGSRLAQYYERAGRVVPLGNADKKGSVTVINAVSPPGGDFSEPVTQSSLRLAGTFWGLDKNLAQQRHFPAINWKTSYSLYNDQLYDFLVKNIGSEWYDLKHFLSSVLDQEKRLSDLVQLVGRDGLSESDKWTLEFADLVKIFFLQQNAFSDEDSHCSLKKQKAMLNVLKKVFQLIGNKIDKGLLFEELQDIPFRAKLVHLKDMNRDELNNAAEKWITELDHSLAVEVIQ